jgi:hypothetical protein
MRLHGLKNHRPVKLLRLREIQVPPPRDLSLTLKLEFVPSVNSEM